MPAYGIDEDWSRLTPAQVLAAGKTWVMGYVSENTTGKNITTGEIRAYLAAGVDVLLGYEYAIDAAEGGMARGVRDAGIAIAQAKAHGYPQGCAIAFAVDKDETGHRDQVVAYARAFTAACHAAGYRSMVYGGLQTVQWCADAGAADLFWQTYAWSHEQWEPRADVRQYQNGVVINGKSVDFDAALVDDFGQWRAGTMTTESDLFLHAYRLGIPTIPVGGSADPTVAPVVWRQRDEQWQAAVTAAFGALSGTITNMSAALDTSTQLHADLSARVRHLETVLVAVLAVATDIANHLGAMPPGPGEGGG